ncbi:MAG: transposase, partial [Candidatus Eisenbacteria bacterium]|nr:transposase [Candidatus Eisenbacteria bacterium]
VAALHDKRQQGKIAHEFVEMFRQRVYGISCGYFDCNDTARIGNDPIMKLVCKTDSCDDPLAAQSTLSRFENAPTRQDLLRAVHAVAVVLRPGTSKGSEDIIPILKRVVPKLRVAFPKAAIGVRLDGEFAAPDVFDWVERENLVYHINLPANAVLARLAEPLMKQVRAASLKSGQTERRYGEFLYAAGTWDRPRHVVFKAERL